MAGGASSRDALLTMIEIDSARFGEYNRQIVGLWIATADYDRRDNGHRPGTRRRLDDIQSDSWKGMGVTVGG